MKSFLNQSELSKDTDNIDDHLTIISGILVETAVIDGKIDNREISEIKKTLINFFEVGDEKIDYIINKSLEKADEPNSLHYFTSKINKEFEYSKKIKLLEILWEIILADGKVHDFESNMVRRLSGLLYISDIDSGNAKKRALTKNIRD